jgi:hypothetical protein
VEEAYELGYSFRFLSSLNSLAALELQQFVVGEASLP